MPKSTANKQKSVRGACKRFRSTGGKIKRRSAFRSHGLVKQNTKRRKQKVGGVVVHMRDALRVKKMLAER